MSNFRGPNPVDSVGSLHSLGSAEPSDQEIVKSNLKFVYWNVQGWTNCDKGAVELGVRTDDIRAQAISVLQPDVLAMSETWLQNNESVKVDNYKWVGNNRKETHQRALRGSGGVGLLINNSLTTKYDIQVLDDSHEDILWVLLEVIRDEDREDSLIVGVCYLPPFGSSRGGNPDAFFDSMIDCLH